jgi:glucose-6-phosphate isomerase
MLKINFENLYLIAQRESEHGVSSLEFTNFEPQLPILQDKIKSRNQGFLGAVNQDIRSKMVQEIEDYTNQLKGKFDTIIVCGIGGSMLGPQTIIDVLGNKFANPKIYFLDNIDPYQIAQIRQNVHLKNSLILIQTKSGGTPETLAQYFYFKKELTDEGLDLKEHLVFVTDPEKGCLRKEGARLGIKMFDLAPNIGGRFSVLTPIGLLVASLAGLNIDQMLEGAETIKQEYFDRKNPAVFNLAIVQYLLANKGKNINVIMPYSSRLKLLANWYTQLLSESIGKELNLEGEKVNVGITPLPALGATDQHSQLQLYKEGPFDKLIWFIEVEDFGINLPINMPAGIEGLHYLENRSFNELLRAEFNGTRQSLTESNRANLTLTIDKVNEYSLGELFMVMQLSVAYLGELYQIDTFNQPGVERSKVLTKEILSN